VDRRAAVVHESGQRQLARARAAAGLGRRLQHQHLRARLLEPHRRRQAVGAGADNHHVAHADQGCRQHSNRSENAEASTHSRRNIENWNGVASCDRAQCALFRVGDENEMLLHITDALRKLVSEVQPADLSSRLVDRLEQFIQEHTNIIPTAVDAICDGRLDDLGRIVQSSQEFAERLLKNQVPETIYLAKIAREFGAVAASAFGAGFGGSVWALVSAENADEFLAKWSNGYSQQFASRAKSSAFFLTEGGQPALDLSDAKIRPAALVRDVAPITQAPKNAKVSN